MHKTKTQSPFYMACGWCLLGSKPMWDFQSHRQIQHVISCTHKILTLFANLHIRKLIFHDANRILCLGVSFYTPTRSLMCGDSFTFDSTFECRHGASLLGDDVVTFTHFSLYPDSDVVHRSVGNIPTEFIFWLMT